MATIAAGAAGLFVFLFILIFGGIALIPALFNNDDDDH